MRRWFPILGFILRLASGPAAFAGSPGDAEFFEARVRPVLIEACVRCHGPQKQSSGLRLDSLEALLEGGENGPGLVPGAPEKSLLIQAVRQTHDQIKMPPRGKLTAPQVDALSEWVRRGASWPKGAVLPESSKASASAAHWAFQPLRAVPPPALKSSEGVVSPVDAFVRARLERSGMLPSPRADRRTLIRRATFDLTGLPPTPEEILDFESDAAPDAFARVVDRLLASPRYGERWGRHWLDVARYADTKGYVFNEDRRYPYAYTYRDYVIRAFNDDLPFDRFILEQLAADRLPPSRDNRALAALGFLTVGRRFLNDGNDIIDDRIDVVTRGLLGLTVSCARCHDHKFDPIPTEDYYALHGVFASSVEPAELPTIAEPSSRPESLDFARQAGTRQAKVDEFLATRRTEIEADFRKRGEGYLRAALDLELNPRHPRFDERARADSLVPGRLRGVIERSRSVLTEGRLPEDLRLLARPSPGGTSGPDRSPLVRALLGLEGGPLAIRPESLPRLLDRAERNQLKALRNGVNELAATHPGAPPKAMVLNDAPQPVNPVVFIRGNPGRRGKRIPRQFLKVLSKEPRKPFDQGSGRLELARAIASPDNPLTARVLVNRVWAFHFGTGLVATPSDFGLRSDPPSHPDLLDHLARCFIEDGWSIKSLHRRIMLSSTYQQRSENRSADLERDPENRLLWKFSRRRLDFESLRDAMLAVSDRLDSSLGGRPVSLNDPALPSRRTVYGVIDRQNLEGIYRTFDFASPDATSPRRHVTTVPQQALFLMNSPFVIEQARRLGAIPPSSGDPEAKVRALYGRILGRPPTPRDSALGVGFVRQESVEPPLPKAAWESGFGEFDPAARRVTHFAAFTHRSGTGWRLGPALPDPTGGYLQLNASGGHTGNDGRHAAIRRWTAPRDATIAVEGTLVHENSGGDGIRGRIVAGRSGALGTWLVHNRKVPAQVAHYEVKAGETIDFVVDCRSEPSFDSFGWSPLIREVEPGRARGPRRRRSRVPLPAGLSPWEEFAQVLLLTNEFSFVD